MKTVLLALFVLAVAFATVVPHVGPVISHPSQTYKVNLDDSPLVRWAQIIKDYEEPLTKFMHYVDLLPISKSFYNGV
jgi:hypothetical protein